MDKKYITTSIPYVNSNPHIGYALELIQTDVLARWWRINSSSVFFLTGADEHGSKIAKVAKEAGITPQELTERNSALLSEMKPLLNLSNDNFIRTSDRDHHWPGAQKLWQKLMEAGDIYQDNYKGLYCVGCEAFITEKDLVNGKCDIHKTEPEMLEESNYFFRLSKYGEIISNKISSGELKIIPEGRAKEILNVINSDTGLMDVSFSRPADKLPWGVPVPGDPTQNMYVWCDALSNYLSGIGYGTNDTEFAKWWPADVQVVGKDILRFHTAIWPAMLTSAGLPLPKNIFVHGFITANGQKMSKSLGNVIDPHEVVKKYGVDAVRYYLLSEIPSTDDGDFSWKRFEEIYNSDLANNLGNLVSRVLNMTQKYFDGKIPNATPLIHVFPNISELDGYLNPDKEINFSKALKLIFNYANQLNQLVDEKKPWDLAKQNKAEELNNVIYQLLEGLRLIAIHLYPFTPVTSNIIHKSLGLPEIDEAKFNLAAEATVPLASGLQTSQPPILFPKSSLAK